MQYCYTTLDPDMEITFSQAAIFPDPNINLANVKFTSEDISELHNLSEEQLAALYVIHACSIDSEKSYMLWDYIVKHCGGVNFKHYKWLCKICNEINILIGSHLRKNIVRK
jgi:hypothetical protein